MGRAGFSYIKTSPPIGAWEVKLEIMTNRPTNRQTDMRDHREVSLPIITTHDSVTAILTPSKSELFFSLQIIQERY